MRRLIAAAALFFVSFLPFHFHFFAATPELTQECSCYHGVRTQAAPAAPPVDCTPVFQASTVEVYAPRVFTRAAIRHHAIRGPPLPIASI